VLCCGGTCWCHAYHLCSGSQTTTILDTDTGQCGVGDQLYTIGNYCILDRQDNGDGRSFPWPRAASIRGDIIFVYTLCGNRERLPLALQDPAYQHPGVALDQGLYEGYSQLWARIDPPTVAPVLNPASTTCKSNDLPAGQQNAPYIDCQRVVGYLMEAANTTMPICVKGGEWYAAVRLYKWLLHRRRLTSP
jgi:hypothetical protein